MNKPRWTKIEQAQFLKRLGELIEKGYSLPQGIEFLLIHESERHQKDLKACLENLKNGELFHEALDKLNFKRDILTYLFFANQHGALNEALLEASNMVTKQIHYQERLRKVLNYPLFMLCFVAVMIYMIQSTLMPQFDTLLSTMNNDEMLTSTLLTKLIQIGKLIIYCGGFVISLLLSYYIFSFRHLSSIDKMSKLAKIPFLSAYVILLTSHYFSIQLSSLLKGGLSIYQALQVFEISPYLSFYQQEAKKIKNQLAAGESLEFIIQSRIYFESELAVVIYHGQTNGEIARELYDYSQYAMQRLEDKIGKVLLVIQPLLFSSIGAIVILMYLAILIPMFNMINTI